MFSTFQILCDSTKLSNPETNNLEHVVRNDPIALCVGGNLTKNKRSYLCYIGLSLGSAVYYLNWCLKTRYYNLTNNIQIEVLQTRKRVNTLWFMLC